MTLRFNMSANVCELSYKHCAFISFVPNELQSNFKPSFDLKELHLRQSYSSSFGSWIDAQLEAIGLSQIRCNHQPLNSSSTRRISFRSLGRKLFSLKRESFLLRQVLQGDFICSNDEVFEWISCLPPTSINHKSSSIMMPFSHIDCR